MNATTTPDVQTDPFAGTYAIDVPGTNRTLVSCTREWFNASDLYTEQMDDIRHGMGDIKDENLLAAVTADSMVTLGVILRDAETATDTVEYAQQEIPNLIFHAWILSDYYAERTGLNTVHNESIFEWVQTDNGIQFLGYMTLQLLNIAERKNCVANGVAYEGPTIISSTGLIEGAESLRDEHNLNFWF